VGRHAESGSDGRDWGNAPVAANRRRTDAPDGLWRGTPAGMSDQPGRERSADGGRSAGRPAPGPVNRGPEAPRQVSRSRLPLPPVPAAAARPPAPRPPTGPRTTAAPFSAVPSPEPRIDLGIDDFPAVAALGSSLDRTSGSAPAIARPSRTWVDPEAVLASTGPGMAGGLRSSPPAPRVPRQAGPAGPPSPAYGDWTKPSRSGDVAVAHDDQQAGAVRTPAPGTSVIPERRMSGRRRQQVAPIRDSIDHEVGRVQEASDVEDRAPAPVRGPGTGPVVGGRAAMRAERQAADMARRKAEKRTGSAVAVLDELETGGAVRKPRRVVKGLLAMTVVALGVLGVYSFVSPETKEVAAQSPATSSSAPALTPELSPLPELPTTPVEVVSEPVAPVRAPVTVLNSTDTTGLAASAAATFAAAGWESPGVGGYTGGDVAASTVFFTEGDETQRQAAVQLVDAFPQLQGPTPRFFELPAGVAAPGLVVVLAADWQP
jgi:hypothetical protein